MDTHRADIAMKPSEAVTHSNTITPDTLDTPVIPEPTEIPESVDHIHQLEAHAASSPSDSAHSYPKQPHTTPPEDMRKILSEINTDKLPEPVRDAILTFTQNLAPPLQAPTSYTPPVAPSDSTSKEDSHALLSSSEERPLSDLDTTVLPARLPTHPPLRQDTEVLRAAILSEEMRQMDASVVPQPVRDAITAFSHPANRSGGVSYPLPEFNRQLETAGVPSNVRQAIVEFTYGHLGVSTIPYFVQGEVSEFATIKMPAVQATKTFIGLTYHRAASALIILFAVLQGAFILQQRTGPFIDEAIYITSGIRALQGYGLADNYLTWFAGSLLWPVFAGAAYLIGGLVAARLLALAFTTIAIFAGYHAARNLFGEAAGFWTALALVLNGPLLHLAHFAVYDQIALAGIATSFWAVTKVGRSDQRRWLVVAAVAFAIAVIAKYPMILCFIPLFGIVLALRIKRAFADIFILLYLAVALLLIYALPLRDQLAAFLLWREQNNPSFGATSAMVRFTLVYYSFASWALAIVGWILAKGKRRLASALIVGLFLWPTYHLVVDNSVGAEKHIVFGFIFGYPLVGLALANAWKWRHSFRVSVFFRLSTLAVILLLAVMGFMREQQLDHGWTDTRPVANYLAAHVRPGDIVLASNAAPYQMYLYSAGKIDSPLDVYDDYRLNNHELPVNICQADWFVDEQNGNDWPSDVRQQIANCGTFVQVYSSTTEVTQVGRSVAFVTYPVQTTVWLNVAKH